MTSRRVRRECIIQIAECNANHARWCRCADNDWHMTDRAFLLYLSRSRCCTNVRPMYPECRCDCSRFRSRQIWTGNSIFHNRCTDARFVRWLFQLDSSPHWHAVDDRCRIPDVQRTLYFFLSPGPVSSPSKKIDESLNKSKDIHFNSIYCQTEGTYKISD